MCLEGTHWKFVGDLSQIFESECLQTPLPCPCVSVDISAHSWDVVRFYFSRVGENSIWIALFTKLNENPEPLKIKIDVLGNHKGNVTYSPRFQLLLSLVVGTDTVIPSSYKLGRTLCPFGIATAQISVWGERKEALHSPEESSSWISRSQSLYDNVLLTESGGPI